MHQEAAGSNVIGAPANNRASSRAGDMVEVYPLPLLLTGEVHWAPGEPFSQLTGNSSLGCSPCL